MESVLLKIRRGETPFYRRVRDFARWLRTTTLPLPKFVHPVLALAFRAQQSLLQFFRWIISFLYSEPLFRGRCESVGRRFRMHKLPYVVGHARIVLGDDVNFFGKVDIFSGSQLDGPRLELGNRVGVGHNVVFLVNREIVVEDDVFISTGVRFMDSDAHPRSHSERAAGLPAPPEEIKPIRVQRFAWIGQNCFIMKGVTIGEGAIVGVNSVVVNDIPAYSVAMGNPARVVVKNIDKSPLKPAATAAAAE